MTEMEERRALCPYCSRPLMKSRRMKFQMGEWRCAHCGARIPIELILDEDLEEEEEQTEGVQESQEEISQEEVSEKTVDDASLME